MGHICPSVLCKQMAPIPTPAWDQEEFGNKTSQSAKARIHCLGMLREPWGAQSIPASTRQPTLCIPREHPQPHTLFRNSTLGLQQLLGKASSEEAPKPEELACASVWVEGSSSAALASSALHCTPLFLVLRSAAGPRGSPGSGTAAVWDARPLSAEISSLNEHC